MDIKTLIVIHIIGMVFTFIYFLVSGKFKLAKEYGDGIRFANPTDVLFFCIIWEITLFINIITIAENTINSLPWEKWTFGKETKTNER